MVPQKNELPNALPIHPIDRISDVTTELGPSISILAKHKESKFRPTGQESNGSTGLNCNKISHRNKHIFLDDITRMNTVNSFQRPGHLALLVFLTLSGGRSQINLPQGPYFWFFAVKMFSFHIHVFLTYLLDIISPL